MNLISVIIPCFNQGIYIDNAVESVLQQTIKDFEIIIVNDGSTDQLTVSKLKDYNKPRTRVIHSTNKGLAVARNKGYDEAKGKFVQFLDADDTILPQKFEKQIAYFEEFPETDVCYTGYSIFDSVKNAELPLSPGNTLGDNPLSDFLFRWERGLSIPIHCALFRKEILPSIPFNPELRAKEDWMLWCTIAMGKNTFRYIDEKLAIYHYHESNMTRNIEEMNYSFLQAAYYIARIIPAEYEKKFILESIKHVNKTLAINSHPDLVSQINDLKRKFGETDKTIDYKIGNRLLKPYRFMKSVITGKKYL